MRSQNDKHASDADRVRELLGYMSAKTARAPGPCLAFPCLDASGDERIAKYERHLHGLLTSTLHELERLQARREGEVVPPPAVADLNVTVDTGPG